VARRNDTVNGWFICDRGRFENSEVNNPERPRYPMVDDRRVDWQEAIENLVLRIKEISEVYGSEALAIVGSSRLSMEAASMLHRLRDSTTAGALCYFIDENDADCAATAVTRLNEETSASMADVRAADLIAIINCNVMKDGPMMALAVRQAWRKGAKVYLVEDSSTPEAQQELPFEWIGVPAIDDIPFHQDDKNTIIIMGCGKNKEDLPRILPKDAKLVYLLDGPNAFGTALLSLEHYGTALSKAIANGKVKGIIAIEADIPPELLEAIPFVAALDWRNTDTVKDALIVLPTTAWVEMDGTFINNEGRAQLFKKVMNPGLPIRRFDPPLHPPRQHTFEVPGGDLRPAWKVVADIIEKLEMGRGGEAFSGHWEKLHDLNAEGKGLMFFHKDTKSTG
jgi:NADH-quinone oxidoreductase subunit G